MAVAMMMKEQKEIREEFEETFGTDCHYIAKQQSKYKRQKRRDHNHEHKVKDAFYAAQISDVRLPDHVLADLTSFDKEKNDAALLEANMKQFDKSYMDELEKAAAIVEKKPLSDWDRQMKKELNEGVDSWGQISEKWGNK